MQESVEERFRRMQEESQAELLAQIAEQQRQFKKVLRQLNDQQQQQQRSISKNIKKAVSAAAAAADAANDAAAAATTVSNSPAARGRRSLREREYSLDDAFEMNDDLADFEVPRGRSRSKRETENLLVYDSPVELPGDGTQREDLWLYRPREAGKRRKRAKTSDRGLLLLPPEWTYHGCLYLNDKQEAAELQLEWHSNVERARLPHVERFREAKKQGGAVQRKESRAFLPRNVRATKFCLSFFGADVSLANADALVSDRWDEHDATWWRGSHPPPAGEAQQQLQQQQQQRQQWEDQQAYSFVQQLDSDRQMEQQQAYPDMDAPAQSVALGPPVLDIPEEVLHVDTPLDFSSSSLPMDDPLPGFEEQIDIGVAMELLLDELDVEEPESDFKDMGSFANGKKKRRHEPIQPVVKKKRKKHTRPEDADELEEQLQERERMLRKHRKQSSRPEAANKRNKVLRRRPRLS